MHGRSGGWPGGWVFVFCFWSVDCQAVDWHHVLFSARPLLSGGWPLYSAVFLCRSGDRPRIVSDPLLNLDFCSAFLHQSFSLQKNSSSSSKQSNNERCNLEQTWGEGKWLVGASPLSSHTYTLCSHNSLVHFHAENLPKYDWRWNLAYLAEHVAPTCW